MSDTPTAPQSDWTPLSVTERRLLGALIEKQKTTPDTYPMTINGLISACNQKSNRDPVLTLEDYEVEDGLTALSKTGLVIRVDGNRTEKWRHNLYEAWAIDRIEMAILAELLLRGGQTEGELRTRASRMETIEDLDTLRARLAPLAQRKLVVFLTPEGRRGTALTHGFHAPDELAGLRRKFANADSGDAPAPRTPAAPRPDELSALRDHVTALDRRVADLESQLDRLRERLG